MIQTVMLSSLHKVFCDRCPEGIKRISALRNEPVSFQVAYRCTSGKFERIFIKVKSDLKISIYDVEYVPISHMMTDDQTETLSPGIYPDILSKRDSTKTVIAKKPWGARECDLSHAHQMSAVNSWRSLWFSVNEEAKRIKSGKHTVTVEFYDCDDSKKVSEESLEIEISDKALPKQKLIYTCWFHCDCLADTYDTGMFDDRFFEICENYVKTAAMHGMNMILLPAFTPPLDTAIGKYRRKAQLVKVTYNKGKYSFDFSLMKRFIDMCRRCGTEYFEHSHFYTQWGAAYTPAIYADVNGKEKRIFGWDVSATDKKYVKFLEAYIPAVKDFFESEGLSKKVMFHISDEPTEEVQENYRKAAKTVNRLIGGYMQGDAMSRYPLYEDGTVKTPIVSLFHIDTFKGKCKNLWAYYTGDTRGNKQSNRIISTPSEVNRSIGFMLYSYGAKGFLHWGYNYYYGVVSLGLFNPSIYPEGYEERAGTSYSVYPALNGEAMPSVRLKVFFEGLNDVRALELLEKLKGRAKCEEIIKKHFGEVTTHTLASSPEAMLAFREEINEEIKNA